MRINVEARKVLNLVNIRCWTLNNGNENENLVQMSCCAIWKDAKIPFIPKLISISYISPCAIDCHYNNLLSNFNPGFLSIIFSTISEGKKATSLVQSTTKLEIQIKTENINILPTSFYRLHAQNHFKSNYSETANIFSYRHSMTIKLLWPYVAKLGHIYGWIQREQCTIIVSLILRQLP